MPFCDDFFVQDFCTIYMNNFNDIFGEMNKLSNVLEKTVGEIRWKFFGGQIQSYVGQRDSRDNV